jgi:CubicO group peptidase (beta-lactamase class C family)
VSVGRSAAALLLLAATACAPAISRGASIPPEMAPHTPARVNALHDSLQHLLDAARSDSAFPGAVAVVGHSRGILTTVTTGTLDWRYSGEVSDESIWDMASLTKVVAMTSAVMQLVDAGRISLDAPVQHYMPEWSASGAEFVTVRHLLTHSSGLPSWRPLYKETTHRDAALELVLATSPDTMPGARMVYSDLGAILLGMLVERVTGEPLDRYVDTHIFAPLGMRRTFYRPDPSLLNEIAPTEFDPWRQQQVRGEVHDENAFRLGGVSAHAGLFSTASDLARFAQMYLAGGELNGTRLFSRQVIETFTAPQNPVLGNRALGWEKPNGRNSAGSLLSERAFGHTGFTGTSIWIDPERDLFVILLTNRVNPTRENSRIGPVRRAVADAAVGALYGDTVRSEGN